MAGGEGTRLRPITENMPKPLVEVSGIPVIEHIFRLLMKHGISEAAVTTRYLGDMIKNRYGESYSAGNASAAKTLRLRYFEEKLPLGTAGGVKNASEIYSDGEPFLVISGDAMTNTDISEMVSFHSEKNADVTIALSCAADPREYGTVLCGRDGRITKFIEKPAWQHVLTDAVNTGIYIINPKVMENIPENAERDFARDLFPALMKDGKKLFGYETSAHWCDIGSIPDYFKENMRISGGYNVFSSRGQFDIDRTSSISESIIYSDVKIGASSLISRSIICDGCTIGKNVTIGNGSVIGSGCHIEDGAFLFPGSRLGKGTVINAGQTYGTGYSEGRPFVFERGGVSGSGDTVSCIRLGLAAASAVGCGSRVGIISGFTASDHLAKNAVLCGLSGGGCATYDFGEGTEAMASFAAARLGMELVMRVNFCDESTASPTDYKLRTVLVSFFDRSGLYPQRSFERALASALDSPISTDIKRNISDTEQCSDLETLYRNALISAGEENETKKKRPGRGISVYVDSNTDTFPLYCALSELGFESVDERDADIILHIDRTGTELSVTDRRGGDSFTADMWHTVSVLTLDEIKHENISQAALPYIVPASLEQIFRSGNIIVAKYGSCPSDNSEEKARRCAKSTPWIYDASFAAVKICMLLDRGTPLRKLCDEIPDFYFSEEHIEADNGAKTRIMRSIGTPDGEGVVIDHGETGRVRIIPECGCSLRIIADSHDTEAANELIALSKKQIEELLGEN